MMIVQEKASEPMSLKHRPPSDDTTAETIPPSLAVLTSSAPSYIQTKNYVFDCNTQLGMHVSRQTYCEVLWYLMVSLSPL